MLTLTNSLDVDKHKAPEKSCVWKKTRTEKSHAYDYRELMVFEKLRFQNVFSSTLSRQFKERFRTGLVWTVDPRSPDRP